MSKYPPLIQSAYEAWLAHPDEENALNVYLEIRADIALKLENLFQEAV
jgi:hypothetical protein